jgi:PrtD family type I secretion system ABC transporter
MSDEVHDGKPLGPGAIKTALRATRPALATAVVFSFFINVLALAGPLYMLQVYDRVLSSRSLSTLVALTVILAFVYAVSSALEMLRSKILVRAGVKFDKVANPDVFRGVQRATIIQPSPRHVQSLRDVDTIREFFTGSGLLAFCDFPWVPVYVIAAFALNPIYGWLAVGGSVITFGLALANEYSTKSSLDQASRNAMAANNHAVATFRNAEVLQAMGMIEALRSRWSKHHEATLGWQAAASNKAGVLIALTKFNRTLLQSLILGVGAYLVIEREVSPGMMIAASIIIGKALAPVEIAIGNWKGFVSMREAYRRVNGLLEKVPEPSKRLRLPTPAGTVTLENVHARAPGRETLVLRNVSLTLPAGAVLGVVGASAAGKSSLARVMVGVWPVAGGTVRLDGADLNHWDPNDLGRHIGYLPQDVELFSGTIAENISRFDEAATQDDIIRASTLAGVHDLVQKLPDGYNTHIGDGGQALSGGQRQRIGLARAIYGMPAVIVLDEPNANLDSVGEQALVQAVAAMKQARRTVVIVTHKTNILGMVDYVLVMNEGAVQLAGPRDEVLANIMGPRVVASPPDKVAAPAEKLAAQPEMRTASAPAA